MERKAGGFALVAAAAVLWASDAFLRAPIATQVAAPVVVMVEHLLLVAFTAPLLPGALRAARGFDTRQVVAVLVVGVGASAVATTLFTLAFAYADSPTTPALLQKLQPVVAVVAATLILGERIRPRFLPTALTALAGAYLISVPDPLRLPAAALASAGLAVGAAVLWALGTVLGRLLTGAATPAQVATLRFAVGLPATALIVWLTGADIGPALTPVAAPRLLALALIPGLLAMMIYYRGLAGTPASLATIAELAFPLTLLLIGGRALTATQIAGVVILAGAVVWLGVADRRTPEATGVVVPA
jgi:DME family drug/metabolite transporter